MEGSNDFFTEDFLNTNNIYDQDLFVDKLLDYFNNSEQTNDGLSNNIDNSNINIISSNNSFTNSKNNISMNNVNGTDIGNNYVKKNINIINNNINIISGSNSSNSSSNINSNYNVHEDYTSQDRKMLYYANDPSSSIIYDDVNNNKLGFLDNTEYNFNTNYDTIPQHNNYDYNFDEYNKTTLSPVSIPQQIQSSSTVSYNQNYNNNNNNNVNNYNHNQCFKSNLTPIYMKSEDNNNNNNNIHVKAENDIIKDNNLYNLMDNNVDISGLQNNFLCNTLNIPPNNNNIMDNSNANGGGSLNISSLSDIMYNSTIYNEINKHPFLVSNLNNNNHTNEQIIKVKPKDSISSIAIDNSTWKVNVNGNKCNKCKLPCKYHFCVDKLYSLRKINKVLRLRHFHMYPELINRRNRVKKRGKYSNNTLNKYLTKKRRTCLKEGSNLNKLI